MPEQAVSPANTPENITRNGNELIITHANRRYRVRGLDKNQTYEQLKINLLVSIEDKFHSSHPCDSPEGQRDALCNPPVLSGYHIDNLDIYSARARQVFIKQSSMELCVSEDEIKTDIGKLLLTLESLQDKQLQQKHNPNSPQVSLSPDERARALALLKSPDLLSRILTDFEAL